MRQLDAALTLLRQQTQTSRVSLFIGVLAPTPGFQDKLARKIQLLLDPRTIGPNGLDADELRYAIQAPLDVALSIKRLLRPSIGCRSEEHTSELQSLRHLVCRLLL